MGHGNIIVHILGLDDPGGFWYLLWSGFGAQMTPNLTNMTLIVGFSAWYRKHNCHQDGCLWIGRFHIQDTDSGHSFIVCKHHHPHFNPEMGQKS